MAVTLEYGLEPIRPAYNENVLVYSSPNSSQPGYRYLTKVSIGGEWSEVAVTQSATLLSLVKTSPNTDGYGILDISRHLEGLVTYDLNHEESRESYIISGSTSFYSIQSGESWTGQAATYGNVYSSASIFNGVVDWVDVPNWNIFDYTQKSSQGNPILTSLPITGHEVDLHSRLFLNFVNQGASNLSIQNADQTLEIKVWNGALLDWTTNNPVSDDGGVNMLSQMSIGPWNINQRDTGGNSIDTNNTHYTVQLKTAAFQEDGTTSTLIAAGTASRVSEFEWTYETQGVSGYLQSMKIGDTLFMEGMTSEPLLNQTFTCTDVSPVSRDLYATPTPATTYTFSASSSLPATFTGSMWSPGSYIASYAAVDSALYRFDIIERCSKYETYQFLFLDRLGSFISLNCNLVSKTNVSVNKTSYTKNYGTFNPTTQRYGWNSYDRTKSRLNTNVKEVTTVNSDWVTEDLSALFDEMIKSPEVYRIDETGTMYAVNILTSDFQVHKRVNDKTYNHTISFEDSFINDQQR